MAGAEVQAPLTGYAELDAAFQIIRGVRKANLKWQPETFDTVLYEGTQLARPEYIGENQILMKNVYYLATKTKNMTDGLVLSLVDEDVLTVQEGNEIMQQPTNKLRAVKMYALLVEKEDPDSSIAKSVVSLLQAHDNEEVIDIFAEKFNIIPANRDDPAVRENPQPGYDNGEEVNDDVPDRRDAEIQQEIPNERWACKYCTYFNSATSNICEICSKTENFDFNESVEVNICPQCTLMNEEGFRACDACGFIFEVRQPVEVDRDSDDYDDDDEDD